MPISRWVLTVVLAVLLGSAADVWGQGTFGSTRNFGGTLSSGQRTFASGVGAGRGVGGVGGVGGVVGTGGTLEQVMGTIGQVGSGDRFLRQNRQPGQFVGSDTQDVGGLVGQVGAGASNRIQSAQTGLGRGSGRGTNRGGRGSGRDRGEVRARMSLGFPHSTSAAVVTRASSELAGRITNSSRIEALAPIEVMVQGRTAVLRGVVATEHDRDLAGILARLEPGISNVQNELVVPERIQSPEAVPAPSSQPPSGGPSSG